MLSKIREDVDESIAYLTRRRERAAVPAIGPKPTATQDERIHDARDANGDALNAPGQSSLVARFDDEVHVIPLHGEVDDSETLWLTPSGASQRDADTRKNVLATQRAKERT